MSWFLCVVSQKPFLEWEIEKFLKVHPQTSNTIIKPSFYFSYDCRAELLYTKKPSEEDPNLSIVMGNGYISKSTGYSVADKNDWDKLLNFEYIPNDIDGHFLALKIRENFLQITTDMFGHYPVYYINFDDYIMVSNKQHFVSQLMGKRQWDYSSISALTLLTMPLEKKSFLKGISVLGEGATLTVRNNKIAIANRELKFISESELELQKYLFSFKKAYELQLNENDFIALPFEASQAARFAFSVWCNKAKKLYGLYYPSGSEIYPEKFLDSTAINKLKISIIPPFHEPNEVFLLYKDYVLKTGLSDFPEYFYLAGNYATTSPHIHGGGRGGTNEINLITNQSEWMFEKEPTKRIDKIFNILKGRSFSDFKKNYEGGNHFFRKEFYLFLLKGLKQHFDDCIQNMIFTDTIYDKYYFYIKNYHINICAGGIAWLNDFRNFYSPGMFYSLTCQHLQQRFTNKNIIETSVELHKSFAEESIFYPKPKEVKFTLPVYPNLNQVYFHLITNEIGQMMENAQKIPYYNLSSLLKIFKKAKKGNSKAIDIVMKWTAFEIWRGYLE